MIDLTIYVHAQNLFHTMGCCLQSDSKHSTDYPCFFVCENKRIKNTNTLLVITFIPGIGYGIVLNRRNFAIGSVIHTELELPKERSWYTLSNILDNDEGKKDRRLITLDELTTILKKKQN